MDANLLNLLPSCLETWLISEIMFWYIENVVVDDDDNDDGHDDDHDDELENVSENEHFSNEQHFNTGCFEKRKECFFDRKSWQV